MLSRNKVIDALQDKRTNFEEYQSRTTQRVRPAPATARPLSSDDGGGR
jgi:hypothetical protein